MARQSSPVGRPQLMMRGVVRAPQVGLSHAMLARHLLCLACSRAGLPCPAIPPPRSPNQPPPEGTAKRETSGGPWEAQQSRSASNGDAEGLRTVRVLFGGEVRAPRPASCILPPPCRHRRRRRRLAHLHVR